MTNYDPSERLAAAQRLAYVVKKEFRANIERERAKRDQPSIRAAAMALSAQSGVDLADAQAVSYVRAQTNALADALDAWRADRDTDGYPTPYALASLANGAGARVTVDQSAAFDQCFSNYNSCLPGCANASVKRRL